jgi:hypothetical protein
MEFLKVRYIMLNRYGVVNAVILLYRVGFLEGKLKWVHNASKIWECK